MRMGTGQETATRQSKKKKKKKKKKKNLHLLRTFTAVATVTHLNRCECALTNTDRKHTRKQVKLQLIALLATVTKMAEATVTTLNSPVRRRNGTAPRTSPPTPSFCTERKGNSEPRPSQIIVWQAHFVAHGEQQRQRQTGRKATQPSGASDRRELARHSLDADRLNYRSRANSEPRRNQQQRMRNRGCGGDHAHAFGRRQAGALLQVRSKSSERHVVYHPRQRASVQRAVLTVSDSDRHTLRPAVVLRVAGDSDATEKSTLVRHSGIVSGSAASDNAATIAERCFRCSSDCCDDTATPDEVRFCLVPQTQR
jgi:hypothetical protein